MTTLKEKLAPVFFPFIRISIAFIAVYSFFNWLIFIRPVYEPFDEMFIFLAPFALSWVPIVLLLRKKIALVPFKRVNQKNVLYFFLAMTIAVTTVMLQFYLQSATGKITRLAYITDYNKTKTSRFYQLDHFFFDTKKSVFYGSSREKGKYGRELEFTIDMLIPVFNSAADTTSGESSFYITTKNTETISNKLSNTEKQKIWRKFDQQTRNKYQDVDFSKFVYLRREGYTSDRQRLKKAVLYSSYVRYHDPVFFVPVNEPFAKRNGFKLTWALGVYAFGCFLILILLLTVPEHSNDYYLTRTLKKT